MSILSSLFAPFRRSNWLTRIAMLLTIVSILMWQARWTLVVHNPMMGWPIPFNNLWIQGSDEWDIGMLLIDAAIWLFLAASVGLAVERQVHTQSIRVSMRQLIGLQATIVVVAVLGVGEVWLRENPGNDSIFPKYAKWEAAGFDVWFDIGLFSDPVSLWLLLRAPIVVSIACAVYVCGRYIVRLLGRSSRVPSQQECPEETTDGQGLAIDPPLARAVLWLLSCIVIVLFWLTALPPLVH